MKFSKINPQDLIFSLDIGTRSIIGTVGIIKDKKIHVICESYKEHSERAMIDGQIHDVQLVAEGVNEVKKDLEKKLELELSDVNIAAAGRLLRTTTVKSEMEIDSEKEINMDIINTLELTAVKKAEEDINAQSKGKLYCVGYSVKNYYLNGYLISNLLSHKGEKISAEVIATFLPRSVVDSLYSVMDKAGLCVKNLTLEPIAAMEAAVPQNLRLLNIALVDIGAGTSDIAISSKDSIVAYGMVPLAGDEITEAIAQTFLADFNTAETIKKIKQNEKKVTYIDALGMENEVEYEDVLKVISPVVNKISKEISSKIIELNGGKAPNAVFLVGGGSYTPNIKETISENLNLPQQRTAVKGREAVTECICENNDLGSIGVTVLGIALIAVKKSGHDFINVTLNGDNITLFNSRNHTVMDLIVQAGINPKLLIGKKGKSMRFIVNGIKRVAFGELPKNSIVKINDKICGMDTEIKDGDIVEIEYAHNGNDAHPKIIDYVKRIETISFYLNDELINIEPIAFIDDIKVELNTNIEEESNIDIILPNTIRQYKKYFSSSKNEVEHYLEDVEVYDDYEIKEGDKIYIKELYDKIEIESEIEIDGNSENVDKIENKVAADIDNGKKIDVSVNGDTIRLIGKEKYIFIDIFSYIDYDLSRPQGEIVLNLNGNRAGYYDELNQGDTLEIYWKKRRG